MPLPGTKSLARLGQLAVDAEDSKALQALASLPGPFLPWSGSSMRPAAIVAILSDVLVNERRTIVECGSGNSTVFTARLLTQLGDGGHVHSLDDHADWATVTQRALEREGLQSLASVVHAPLMNGWYDRARMPEVSGIDLLVVDGPPAYERETARSREPALEVFWERLAPGATIVLDDSWREGEQQVISAWEQRYGIKFAHQAAGLAVART